MLDVLNVPHVKFLSNKVLCAIVDIGLHGETHVTVASVIREEAEKITECNSTLNAMLIIALKPPEKP